MCLLIFVLWYSSALVSSSWLISRSSRRTVWLDLGVHSLTLVCNISNIAAVSVYSVGHLLKSAVRKSNIVTSAGGVSISVFIGTVVV